MTESPVVDSLDELAEMAGEHPVVAELSALEKRILEKHFDVEVLSSVADFWWQAESVGKPFKRNVVINDTTDATGSINQVAVEYDPPADGLRSVDFIGSAYNPSMNRYVNDTLEWTDVEETTLCQSAIAERVVRTASNFDVCVVIIVDGLSYHDWRRYGDDATPVYVDCPTITECGYLNVVRGGTDGYSLGTRLAKEAEINNRLAFTYWEKEQSDLTRQLHTAFSRNNIVSDIEDFSDVVNHLESLNLNDQLPLYLQITLTGPERVAHRLKENPDIKNEVEIVQEKLTELRELLDDQVKSYYIAATADHGMLWRMDVGDELVILDENIDRNKRRYYQNPNRSITLPPSKGNFERWDETRYLRLNYPYLFGGLASNEPGTHGGYSFQEAIVPLIEFQRRSP